MGKDCSRRVEPTTEQAHASHVVKRKAHAFSEAIACTSRMQLVENKPCTGTSLDDHSAFGLDLFVTARLCVRIQLVQARVPASAGRKVPHATPFSTHAGSSGR